MEPAELRLKEKLFGLFEPDVLLPVQYFDLLRRKAPLDPERRLMWAVLEDAVDCYRKNVGGAKPKRDFDEVESWILDPDGDWFFSFENICATLGIDADYLRCGLLALKEKFLTAEPAGHPVASDTKEDAPRGAGKGGYERLTAVG
jgi:hypothetical protein